MAKAKMVQKFKSGQIEIVQWEGSYQDQPTTYYTVQHQKFDKEAKEWKDNPFFNKTDLLNLWLGVSTLLSNSGLIKPKQDVPDF